MKKGKKLIVRIGTEGDVTIAAYCLSTDSWQDYLSFNEEAKGALKNGDYRQGNRYLRAGLLFLFSHLEGVVNYACDQLPAPSKIRKKSTLDERRRFVHTEAERRGHVPELNFRLGKYLRDILAHPGIEKTFENEEKLDEVSVYEKLTPESLEEIGDLVDRWLNAVCTALVIERFTDMKKMVEEFGSELGEVTESKEV
jgi:hypothetical protein